MLNPRCAMNKKATIPYKIVEYANHTIFEKCFFLLSFLSKYELGVWLRQCAAPGGPGKNMHSHSPTPLRTFKKNALLTLQGWKKNRFEITNIHQQVVKERQMTPALDVSPSICGSRRPKWGSFGFHLPSTSIIYLFCQPRWPRNILPCLINPQYSIVKHPANLVKPTCLVFSVWTEIDPLLLG